MKTKTDAMPVVVFILCLMALALGYGRFAVIFVCHSAPKINIFSHVVSQMIYMLYTLAIRIHALRSHYPF